MNYKSLIFVLAVFLFAGCDLFKEKNTLKLTIEVGDCANSSAKPNVKVFADILVKRLVNLGYPERNIMIEEKGNLIYLTINYVDDPERVKKNIQVVGKLEMCETFENMELGDRFNKLNEMLKAKADTIQDKKAAPVEAAATLEELLDSAAESRQLFKEFELANPLFALLRPNIYQNESGKPFYAPGPVVGMCLVKDTAKVNAIFKSPDALAMLPKELRLCWAYKPFDEGQTAIQLVAVKTSGHSIDGRYITEARQTFSSFNDNKPEISITMNAEGAERWRMMTAANIGHSIAMIIDDRVYSFPTVQAEIPGGRSSITGNFTIEEAQDFAGMLNGAYLPCRLRIVEENVERK